MAGTGKIRVSIPMRLLSLVRWIPGLRGNYPQPRFAHRRQRVAATAYDGTDRLGQVACSTLILHGCRDRSIPLQRARDLHDGFPGSRLQVFSGGHMFSLLSQRDQVAEAIDAFLA